MTGKITNSEFTYTVSLLKKYGFTKRELGAYLMYGLPGQSLDEVKDGVQFLKSFNVRINLTEFSPLPQTECFKQLVKSNVITEDIDPLLTNNIVFSWLFAGYKHKDLKKLKEDVIGYNRK